MTLIRTFLPIILGGTIILTILMLPVYFIRKKKNPDVKRNTIIRLIVLSFAAVSIFVLLLVVTFAYKVTEHETFIGKIIKRK